MEMNNYNSDAEFRKTLISTLVDEINEESMCLYPVVTKLEVTQFLNRWATDLVIVIENAKKKCGISRMSEVFYFTKEEFKHKYFNEVLKYVHFDKKNFSDKDEENILA